jgi:hypothetical protein
MAYITYKRPVLVKIICIFGFIFGVLFSMGLLFSPETRKLGDFFPALFGLLVAGRFIAYVGIWYMKRWGVELLLITFAATLIKALLMNEDMLITVIWHIVILTYLMFQYKKMDRNL